MAEVASKELIVGSPRLLLASIMKVMPLTFCQGCQHMLIAKIISELIEELGIEQDTIFIGGVGCHAMLPMLINVDGMSPGAAHGRACDISTALKRVLGKKTMVINIQGDGDAIAIGTEPTIQAAARGEKITLIMANNTNYGTTGGQMAPTTVMGQTTTTTPFGRGWEAGYPINTAELMASIKGVVYSARGSVTSPDNWRRTKGYVRAAIQKQIDDIGFSFVEVLVACPTNWGVTPVEAVKRIEEKVIPQFPLGVFKDVANIE